MQFAGINGVLYYTPQILEQAGVGVLLSNIGLSSSSASILISALTTLLMLPSIGIAMRLMDMSGRRSDFKFHMLLPFVFKCAFGNIVIVVTILLSCLIQVSSSCNNSNPDSGTSYFGPREHFGGWNHGSCCPLYNQCHNLFLLLRHGVRAYSKHPLC
jgi:MFS family permease